MRTCHAALSQVTFAKRVLYMELVCEVTFVDCRVEIPAASMSRPKREKARAEMKKDRRQCMMSMGDVYRLYDCKQSERFNGKALEIDELREQVCTLGGV